MKPHFLIFTICFALFFQLQGVGQTLRSLEAIGTAGNQDMVRTYEGVKGSPYLFDDWISGEIVLEDSSTYDEIPLRYNVYHDALIAKMNHGEMLIDKQKIRGFTLGKPGIKNFAHFLKATYLEDFQETPPEQFVQILYDGPSALYAVNKKELVEANDKGTKSAYDKFAAATTDYYLRTPEGTITKVKPEKETLLKIFSSKKQEVEAFIRKNNLVLEEGTDLVKLLMFYDQLNS